MAENMMNTDMDQAVEENTSGAGEGLTKETALVVAGIALAGAVVYKAGEVVVKKAVVPGAKKVGSGIKKIFTKKETEKPDPEKVINVVPEKPEEGEAEE